MVDNHFSKAYSTTQLEHVLYSQGSMYVSNPLGKSNKSVEDVVNCFFYSNLIFLNRDKSQKDERKKNINEEKHIKYINKVGEILSDVTSSNKDKIIRCAKKLIDSSELVGIFFNLHEYAIKEIKVLKIIFKALLTIGKSGWYTEVNKFLSENIHSFISALFENLKKLKSDCAIFIVFKLIKNILKIEDLNRIILNMPFLVEIFNFSKSEKFIISIESFRILFGIIEGTKIDSKYFHKSLEENPKDFCNLINLTITSKKQNDDFYYVKRETLKVVIKILSTKEDSFIEFKQYYFSSVENLKIIMSIMNHTCMKLRHKAIYILNYFFEDLEFKNKSIQNILLANKNNFENYFEKMSDGDCHILEKKTYILYELERLQNLS